MGDGVLSLRLSEVLADPVEPGVDGAYEWVELVNTAAVAVSTEGWSIGDGSSLDPLPAVEVPPGGFVVVAAEAALLPVNALIVRTPDGTIGNGLNNAGDALRLLSPGGEVVDALSFGENRSVFAMPPAATDAGVTLGARTYEGLPRSERWAETLRPSPGEPNVFAAAVGSPTAAASVEASAVGDGQAPTAGNTSGGAATTEPAGTPVPLAVRFERESGSRTPWVALGAVAGVSVVLTLASLRGAWRAGWGRRRRGG